MPNSQSRPPNQARPPSQLQPNGRDEPSDEELMGSLCMHDDADAFGTLCIRWRVPIQRMCYRMVGSWQDAEDLCQDVFSKLFQFRKRYRVEAKFSTYLWRIAVNRCTDFLRVGKPSSATLSDVHQAISNDGDVLDQLVFAETQGSVQAAIAQLPDIYRTVLILKHYEKLKVREVADALEIPLGTVASRLAKAMDQLKSLLIDGNINDRKKNLTEIEI
jgi:RNA polymerase sigma-70 factor, ECF subfamily